MGGATLRTGSPKFHPGLLAVRENKAGRFECILDRVDLRRLELGRIATLCRDKPIAFDTRSHREIVSLPPQGLPRRPDLSAARDQHATLARWSTHSGLRSSSPFSWLGYGPGYSIQSLTRDEALSVRSSVIRRGGPPP